MQATRRTRDGSGGEEFPAGTVARRPKPTHGRKPSHSTLLHEPSSPDNRRGWQDGRKNRQSPGNRGQRNSTSRSRGLRKQTDPVPGDQGAFQTTPRRTIPSHSRTLRASASPSGEVKGKKTTVEENEGIELKNAPVALDHDKNVAKLGVLADL